MTRAYCMIKSMTSRRAQVLVGPRARVGGDRAQRVVGRDAGGDQLVQLVVQGEAGDAAGNRGVGARHQDDAGVVHGPGQPHQERIHALVALDPGLITPGVGVVVGQPFFERVRAGRASTVGEPSRLSDFLEFMKTYGIVSLVKSGRIALAKDAKSQTKKQRQSA